MKFLTNLTLGKKITLLTAVGLLLGGGFFSSLSMRAVNQATETMLQDRLTTAHLVADYVDEALRRALVELENTARIVGSERSRDGLAARMGVLEESFSRLSIYPHSIYLFDGSGRVTWSRPDPPRGSTAEIPSYPIVSQVMDKGRPSVSELVAAPGTGAPVIFLASPTGEGWWGSRGVLAVAIDLRRSTIGGFVRPITLGQTGYVEIVDLNGIVVARTEPGPELSPFEESDHRGRFMALISAGKPTRGVCHTCHVAGQRVARKDVLAFVPLSAANWGVVIRQSEDEALSPARQLLQNLILFGVGLVSIALMLVVVTTRDVGTRISMLTAASQRIAEGDLVTPVTTQGRDEVGILAGTLDGMRTKLKTSYGDLERRTKELSSLLSVSEILASTTDLPRLLDAVVAKAVEVIPGADAGALVLQDAEGKRVLLPCAIGLDEGLLSQMAFISGSSAASDVSRGLVDESQRDMVTEAVAELLQSGALRSRVSDSIQAEAFQRDQHAGTLVVLSFREGHTFSESDHRLLGAIADGVAVAIEKARLTGEAEEARALHEADRLRSQFISSVSHELRTPLTLIKGYSTSLLRRDVSWQEDSQREFLRIIDEKTDELAGLIDKLLQSAKLEAGALRLEKEPLLIPRLAQKVVGEIEPRTDRHRFVVRFPQSFPVVEADARCIEQVVRNLVENAVKYSPGGGEIIVAGEVEPGRVVVSVSDQGVGIPPEHRERVFERFYRVESPLTRGTPGSGLGLSICRGHVEAHGGRIWLESAAGEGSRFSFSLPLEPEDSGE